MQPPHICTQPALFEKSYNRTCILWQGGWHQQISCTVARATISVLNDSGLFSGRCCSFPKRNCVDLTDQVLILSPKIRRRWRSRPGCLSPHCMDYQSSAISSSRTGRRCRTSAFFLTNTDTLTPAHRKAPEPVASILTSSFTLPRTSIHTSPG